MEYNQKDLLQAMHCLKNSKVYMVDHFENKVAKEQLTFNFIDVERKAIVNCLNMLNTTQKCFL